MDRVIAPNLPPAAPLAMPTRSLAKAEPSDAPAVARQFADWPWLARVLIFGGAWAVTIVGGREMYRVVSVGDITVLAWALLVLFVINFSFIALACSTAFYGFVWLLRRAKRAPAEPPRPTVKTAVLMPIYNEEPSRVFAAVEAMAEEVDALKLSAVFDFFFLSDTNNPNVWVAEERAFASLRARAPGSRFYYRRRKKNVSRKAGNIADFVMRFGAAYPQMIVLDADSLMTGEAMATLAEQMEKDQNAGIVQSLPLIVNRNTLFARTQQFAARFAGPILAAGLAAWMGRDGNYWGHNAIIRTRAFAEHCGLPNLKGKPPLGGHILSHDFVEAALMRRAGYGVYMLPTLAGSYEESPPSLIDLAARDRRWCQGNLQHSRMLAAPGLKLATRQHFVTGIMGYLASPLWMAQLLIGLAIVLQSKYVRPEYFTSQFSLFPAWPRFDYERALRLFELTIAVLIAPKALGLVWALLDSRARKASGGGLRMTISTVVEILISAAIAPIMMLIQTGSVVQILTGRDAGWSPQRRDDGTVPFAAIARRHRAHMALGVVTLFVGMLISPTLVLWMSPTILGLLLAIPLSYASGSLKIGMALRRAGLLVTPEEREPPAIVARANALAETLAAADHVEADALKALWKDERLRAIHEAYLPEAQRRARGQVEVDDAVAIAKLTDARTIEEACKWLTPKERLAVLSDRALLALLARLPADVALHAAEAANLDRPAAAAAAE